MITVSNAAIPAEVIDSFTDALEGTLEESCPNDVESCQVTISNVQSTDTRLKKLSRLLQDSLSLVALFEMDLKALCSTSDCSDSQAVANALYAQVSRDIDTSIENGSFLKSLRAASAELATLLANAIVTCQLGEFVVPDLTLQSISYPWYPDWRSQSHTCLNKGDAPSYMKNAGTFFESSLEACCNRYYSWDVFACTGGVGTAPSGFYPNWEGTKPKCLNSTETPDELPDYMWENPEWLSDDLETCCETHFGWAKSECIGRSGGDISALATGKWYVNHQDQICQQDCAEAGGTCGGLAKPHDTLYDTPAACCAEKLSWIVTSTCEVHSTLSTSTGVTAVGTNQWYIDWWLEKCVKDCDESLDPSCGGLAKRWDELFGSSSECCDRIAYIERAECT